MEVTRIGVPAPGFRPVASAAFDPRIPIPIPPPRAASPTAIALVAIFYSWLVLFVFESPHGLPMVRLPKVSSDALRLRGRT